MDRIKTENHENNTVDLRSTQWEFCSWWGCSQLHKVERCEYCPVLSDIYRMAEHYGIRLHRCYKARAGKKQNNN